MPYSLPRSRLARQAETNSSAISAVISTGLTSLVGLLIGSDHRQMHTADTLLKPLKQDAVHRYIYMAYLKNGAYTSAVEQIIAFAEAHALQEEGTQLRSGFAPANRQTTA